MVSRRFIAALVAIGLRPSVARACSPAIGVDLDAFLRGIALPGRIASAVSLVAAVAWLIASRKLRNGHNIALMTLALLNPGWLIWGIGDCGTLAFETGGAIAILSLGVLAHGLWTRRAQRQANTSFTGV